MSMDYKMMLVAFGGIAIGAAAVQGLHAQAKPPVYEIAEVTVTNPKGYATEFVPKIVASIKEAGGRVIALGGPGGAGAGAVKGLKGKPPVRVAIQHWDNMDQFQAFWNSQSRKDAEKIGEKYASFREYLVEGVAQ